MAVLARKLGVFDASMAVMGGIIGSGIFINPYIVARYLHTPALILGAWIAGGGVALAGAFLYAELADRRPQLGGQYAYLREAYHPVVAFMYGWGLLLVIQSGAMAAVAVTFARYFREFSHFDAPEWLVAMITLALLTGINCLGVRAGSSLQNFLMLIKIGAIATIVACGWILGQHFHWQPQSTSIEAPVVASLGGAMTPILFAYGGWQTASFLSGEMRDPRRDLARGVLFGVMGVITIYLLVNATYLNVLGSGLAATTTPASSMMRSVLGERGALFTAGAIAISTLGFLSQGMLTAPRVYMAMAADGVFFRQLAYVSEKTRVPVVAIAVQGAVAAMIALSGKYEQILSYVTSSDFIFFGLTGASVFLFRRRDPQQSGSRNTPGHPWTTIFFVAACWLVVAGTVYNDPRDSLAGWLILSSGVPVYFLWKRRRPTR